MMTFTATFNFFFFFMKIGHYVIPGPYTTETSEMLSNTLLPSVNCTVGIYSQIKTARCYKVLQKCVVISPGLLKLVGFALFFFQLSFLVKMKHLEISTSLEAIDLNIYRNLEAHSESYL